MKICVHVSSCCLLIASGFTVTSRYWKHIWVFVFVDFFCVCGFFFFFGLFVCFLWCLMLAVGIWEKPAFVGTALWNDLLSGCLSICL